MLVTKKLAINLSKLDMGRVRCELIDDKTVLCKSIEVKECAEGKMVHSSLLFDIQKHFFFNSFRSRPTPSQKIMVTAISVLKSSLVKKEYETILIC
jgi:hypothetical protein